MPASSRRARKYRPGCWRSPATRRCPRCGGARPLQKTERSEVLRDCLKQLSPAHREIIDLVYYHERTIDDVAEIIGVPQNTVKTRMFYARKRIGELLAARGLEHALV
jgi:DNA-directed RNA polymerase specialized sigma24 family protein